MRTYCIAQGILLDALLEGDLKLRGYICDLLCFTAETNTIF